MFLQLLLAEKAVPRKFFRRSDIMETPKTEDLLADNLELNESSRAKEIFPVAYTNGIRVPVAAKSKPFTDRISLFAVNKAELYGFP